MGCRKKTGSQSLALSRQKSLAGEFDDFWGMGTFRSSGEAQPITAQLSHLQTLLGVARDTGGSTIGQLGEW